MSGKVMGADRASDDADRLLKIVGRVEVRRGGAKPRRGDRAILAVGASEAAPTPFPHPAHQTGRACFRHPAFRWTSPVDSRTSVIVDIAKPNYPQPPEYRFARKLTGAPRLHLMTPPQEMADAFLDVVVHRSIGHRPSTVGEVRGPTPKGLIPTSAYFCPGTGEMGLQQLINFLFDALLTFLRGTGSAIPCALLPVAMRSQRVP